MIQLSGKCAEYRDWKSLLAACLLGSSLTLSACATTGTGTQPTSQANSTSSTTVPSAVKSLSLADRTMVNDLSNVVSQIFEPYDTTLQITRNNEDPIMQYFVGILADRGFGIQRVSADQGAHFLSYERQATEGNGDILFSVSIGPVLASRHYQLLRENMVTPVSMVQLSGTRVPVTVADTPSGRFKVTDPALSKASYVATLSLDEQAPVISLITPDIVSSVTSRSVTGPGPSLQALNASQIEVSNLFYGSQSNFASVLDDYERVDRQIVVFGNDSMILGDTNKQLIDQFVNSKLRRNDVISLVGCSNGPTALDIGNEGLALGRARRVTEALMELGVARERILDEGCWAPVSARDRFPSRGVVLELWRSLS